MKNDTCDKSLLNAMAGTVFGATIGEPGVPRKWIDGICDYPRYPVLLQKIAGRLAAQKIDNVCLGSVKYPWPMLIPRNVVFLIIVLMHGFRRLLPPY